MKINDLFGKIDELNNLTTENRAVLWLERIAFVFLTIMILFAPHSIAVTQSAWLIGMLAWAIRLFFAPRPKFKLTAIDYALWTFFAWSVVSSIFSYAPDISLDKLRGVSLFLIFYFVYNNLRTIRAAKFLVFALIFSTMFAVVWTPIERIIGRGVEVHGLIAESPLLKAKRIDEGLPIGEGKTVVQVGKKKIYSPEGLVAEIEKNETSRLTIYHTDFYSVIEVNRVDLLNGATAEEKLGINDWKRNHNWRAAGFYGHYTTFAEALQLIISLTFGIFVALFSTIKKLFSRPLLPIILAFCVGLMAFALLLTVTRASQFAFLISAVTIVLLNGNRKIILTLAAAILPLVLIGLLVLQQSREIGANLQDNSTQYRMMMWRDGSRLLTASPRNLVFGVGMDSIQRYWFEWGLYDKGWQPKGHFHSTPMQLAVERGLPALIIWLTILGIYARTLWRYLRKGEKEKRRKGENFVDEVAKNSSSPHLLISSSQIERGIILGCFGGLIGFFTSGLVHYNIGDGEVAMVFYILMGIGVFVCNFRFQISN